MLRGRIDSSESEGKSITTTNPPAAQAGSYRVGDLDLNRIGYGAMQLAGPGVFGPPRDRAAAIEVLRTAVELGVNHIDTADAYGPYITNKIIREALFPYGDHVHIVTNVGLVRDERGGWLAANSPQSLREQMHDNLRRLGLDVLDVLDLRTLAGIDDRATVPDTLTPQFEALAELQQQGLIRYLGLSTVSLDQLAEAQQIAPVVCVQQSCGSQPCPPIAMSASSGGCSGSWHRRSRCQPAGSASQGRDHGKGSQVRRVRRDRRVAGRGGGTPGARGRAGPGTGEGGWHQPQ
jgi:Aldo/keto reductase family